MSPGAFALDLEDTRLLAEPAISREHVAFIYAGDLWLANRDGSGVKHLTSHLGTESSPRFSPDGQHIAFSAEYDGNIDVFVVPVTGGTPTRLTWHPGPDLTQGFTPDGSSVVFASRRQVFTNRHVQLFTVPVGGGFPTRLPVPTGLRAAVSPDGEHIAYIPIPERHQQWKNYRGGTTSRIWIQSLSDDSVVEVERPEGRSNDTDPVWIGERLFFRSDRAGEFNVFSFDPKSHEILQHTSFEDFPVLALSGDGSTLVLEQAGWLWLLEAVSGAKPQRLRIGVSADVVETRPRWVKGARYLRDGDISPSGARSVLEFRGEIITLPAKKGDPRNLSQSPGAHERSPTWSPDGKSIAYFSDASGEYRLHIVPQDGRGEARTWDLEGHGFFEDPQFSPDGRFISYRDNSWTLYILELESGDITRVASARHYGPGGTRPLSNDWSPDSRYLVYTADTEANIEQVFVYDLEEKKSIALTDGLSDASEPVFDQEGRYVFFLASTDAGPVRNWFAMSNADMVRTRSIYVAVLRADDDSPLAPESDEEPASDGSDDNKSESAEKANGEGDTAKSSSKPEVASVRIDAERLDQRILELPLSPADYTSLEAGDTGKIYYLESTGGNSPLAGSSGGTLAMFDLKTREQTVLLSGVSGYTLSHDNQKLLYTTGATWGIADAGKKIDTSETSIAVDRLEVKIDPVEEWQQIFDEVWRINRDYFYDPGMHGADWEAMGERYTDFLPHVTSRADLNRVLQWMCSELAVGHHRVGGGDEREEADTVPGGLLGADFEIDRGRYRFKKVFGGLNFTRDLRAPLTEPGVSVEAGAYLLAVDGRELSSSENVYARFENTAGKAVTLTVGPDASGEESRDVTVVPIESEEALRNRDWVEGNLAKVDKATGGRVAYVYVPNTTNQGHTYFKRYFYPQVHKQAIIVDERFNGGGQVADYYIDHLRRPFISYWATRYGQDLVTPNASIRGPKVMLIDETAGSGGDLLPWMFRQLDLGKLIGKRTWGGLVGTLGFPVLMDGGFVTAPNLAIWTEDGFIVENVGVPPDIEVEQWPAEVNAGRDPQLEKAIEVILEELERNPPPDVKRPPFPIRVRH